MLNKQIAYVILFKLNILQYKTKFSIQTVMLQL